ncbi:sulfate ABC transporter permease subunit CysT [Spirochaeta cellobiosiphila]|uniref:sulfate ABC transporter permease subunit CysT n=1 Tax=Spirochaeta cellobiosiphila TaxID=504483 RepID=UPI00040F3EFC|nr:sulfate ABC transporter permease subunit CysT [Spirochaeta cellobiosiphila]
MIFKKKDNNILPGKSLSLTIVLMHTTIVLIIPLIALVIKGTSVGLSGIIRTLLTPATLYAIKLTLGISALAALFNLIMGLITSWALVRYDFPGKSIMDSMLDLPFAIPGAVGGVALAAFFGTKSFLGAFLKQFDIQLSYSPIGIFIALTFVGLPFVVRSLQPVIEGLDKQEEEASLLLGASPFKTFKDVIFPALIPGLISGFIMAFARGIGEFGTVIFIAGNLPFKSEVLTQIIYNKIDTYDTEGAAALSLAILTISLITLIIFNAIQSHTLRKSKA